MNDAAVKVEGVWKKFRRGQFFDSLRDAVPALAKRVLGGGGTPRDQLGKREFWALEDVDFSLFQGEALGIIGPNGAGKSTLLKVLSRILRPNRGQVRIRGRLTALLEVAAGFHGDLTGRENVYLNGAILGMSRRQIAQRLEAILNFAGLEDAANTPVKRYSSGMKARLGFAIAAHLEPEILLVDEVLSVGDAAFRARCLNHMTEMIRSDVSVIFISHNLDQVRQLCSRCLVLDAGRLRFEGDPHAACEEYYNALAEATHTPASQADSPGRLTGVRILDDLGQPTRVVNSLGDARIEVRYQLTRSVPEIALTVAVFTASEQLVADCNTVRDAYPLPATAGDHTVLIDLRRLPLGAGDFWIGCRLTDPQTGRPFDERPRNLPLVVQGAAGSANGVLLDHRWHIGAPSEDGP